MNRPCGCCGGAEHITPAPIANRFGLDALAVRVGQHGSFLETMVARLSDGDLPALDDLTTRAASDPSIALLDAWATVADVLTFYQERIANEGYLRTATERRSILELARLVGYKLRPGVAASVYLAFTVEKGYRLAVPPGTRAQTVPGPGELPQPFETAETLDARAEWSTLPVRLTEPIEKDDFAADTVTVYFQGVGLPIKLNDLLVVIVPNPGAVLLLVDAVLPEPGDDRTRVAARVIDRGGTTVAPRLLARFRERMAAHIAAAPQTATAVAVTADLEKLHADLESAPPVEHSALLRAAVERLEGRLANKVVARSRHVGPWIGRLATALTDLHDSAVGEENGERAAGASRIAPLSDPQLFRRLTMAPAQVPASPRELRRPPEAFFAGRSELASQIFVGVHRNIEAALATVRMNAAADASTRPSTALCAGAEAAIFGHNVPPRTVFSGSTPLTQDWPFSGKATLMVSWPSFETFTSPADVSLGATVKTDIDFAAGDVALDRLILRPTLGDVSIQLEYRTPGADSHATGDAPLTLKFESGEGARSVTLAVAGNQLTVQDGQSRNLSVDGRRLGIRLDDKGLVVSDELPSLAPDPKTMLLDAVYDQIRPGTLVAVVRDELARAKVLEVKTVRRVVCSDYNITATVNELTFEGPWYEGTVNLLADVQGTRVLVLSRELRLAERPISTPITGPRIELAGVYEGLESGRWLIVTGERTDLDGTTGVYDAELVMLARAEQPKAPAADPSATKSDLAKKTGAAAPPEGDGDASDPTRTVIVLADGGLSYAYDPKTVTIYANVAKATHGETRKEVLGSGAGGQAWQEYGLRQLPLTYLAAPTPVGAQSTLEVRVNDVAWHETESFVTADGNDRCFVTRADDDDKTTVMFGDGIHGARLPTGRENVTAVYRTGIGSSGNARARQISLLATKPLGLKGVINPLPAGGGADRESRDQARRNVPVAIMALDRLVSVRDYEDFARRYAGIGKAKAKRVSNGTEPVVHLTIAGAGDIPIERTSDLFRNLCASLRRNGNPHQPLMVELRNLSIIVIAAYVRVQADYLWDRVEPKVRAALLDAFGFERRQLDQPAYLSELIGVIQGVEGVAYVDVDTFGSFTEMTEDPPGSGTFRVRTPAEITKATRAIRDDSTAHGPANRVPPAEDVAQQAVPSQLAYLLPNVRDTLILNQVTR